MHISISYLGGLNKMTREGENGQIGFTDEELNLDTSSQEATLTPESIPPEPLGEVAPEPEKPVNLRTLLLSTEVGMMKDPNPPTGQKAQEISIHNFLLREVDNSWQEAQHKTEIARIIIDRFHKDPEAIRQLAQAYRLEYTKQLEEDIEELKRELAESIDKYDDVYNPRAAAQQDNLRVAIKNSERTLDHKKLVANDIAYGLEKIAKLI